MWQKMIQELRDAGYKWRQIGEAMGIGRSSVHDLWTGRSTEPSGNAAVELVKLHKRMLRKQKRMA